MKKLKNVVIPVTCMMTALSVWLCPLGCVVANATGEGEVEYEFGNYDFTPDYAGYNGRVDSFTEQPIDQIIEEGITTENVSRRMITSGEYYDFDQHAYAYPIDSGLQEVYSNVADGMVVNEPVVITIPDGIILNIYRNGDLVDYVGDALRDYGEYSVTNFQNGKETKIFSFTIIGNKTGQISSYTMPTGFQVLDVKRDGEDVDYSRSFVPMEAEGNYEISYVCSRTEMTYTLVVGVDHTPPQVTFTGVDAKGRSYGPVTIEGLEPTDIVQVIREGENQKVGSNKLTASGHYEVWVMDEAMNTVSETFTIMIYLDHNGIIFVVVVVAVIGAFIAYLLWSRKHLRIR